MKELILLNVQAINFNGVTKEQKKLAEKRYLDAVVDFVNGDVQMLERSQKNASQCLCRTPIYPSGNMTVDNVIAQWEAINLAGVVAAFEGHSYTGGAHFTLDFWTR